MYFYTALFAAWYFTGIFVDHIGFWRFSRNRITEDRFAPCTADIRPHLTTGVSKGERCHCLLEQASDHSPQIKRPTPMRLMRTHSPVAARMAPLG